MRVIVAESAPAAHAAARVRSSARGAEWVLAGALSVGSFSFLYGPVEAASAIRGAVLATALVAVIAALIQAVRKDEVARFSATEVICALIAFFAILQIALGASVYSYETRQGAVEWLCSAAICYLARLAFASRSAVREPPGFIVPVATAAALWALAQILRGPGEQHVANGPLGGLFASTNEYAEFIELALPVFLVRALEDAEHRFVYAIGAALLFASVAASGSRMGALIMLLETPAVIALALLRRKGRSIRTRGAVAAVGILCIVLTFSTGLDKLIARTFQESLVEGRDQIIRDTASYAQARPIAGFGLDTFVSVYPAHASRAFGGLVNHAHNDWLEFFSDGGLILEGLVVLLLIRLWKRVIFNVWPLGIFAVCVHACSDFPLHRFTITLWLFAMIGAVEAISEGMDKVRVMPRHSL